MPRTALDARRLGLSVDARPPLRTSRKTRHTASGRSAGTEPPTTPGCFPHRARPDPRGFLLVRFSNVGRHRAGRRRHAAAHIEKPTTKRSSEHLSQMSKLSPFRTWPSSALCNCSIIICRCRHTASLPRGGETGHLYVPQRTKRKLRPLCGRSGFQTPATSGQPFWWQL